MPIRKRFLDENGFTHTHTVAMNGDMPEFRTVAASSKEASVYMWVSPTEVADEYDALYAGKAGRGVEQRLRQHRGGFVNNGTGRKNRALIAELIATGRSVMVYVRVSAKHQVFGTDVSLYATEEHALCHRFMPRWNRATFPQTGELPALEAAPIQAQDDALLPVEMPDFAEVADADEITAFLGALPPEKQMQFTKLVGLIQERDPNAGQKVVGGFAGQPPGYNNKPTLTFGRIDRAGRVMDPVGRIPLVDEETHPLTVCFPATVKAQDIDEQSIAVGTSGMWRPLSLSHFLENRAAYLG